MAKATKKTTKSNHVPSGPHFNPGKPVMYMVAAILTCLCLALGGFMVGYNVGVKTASAEETQAMENTSETTNQE